MHHQADTFTYMFNHFEVTGHKSNNAESITVTSTKESTEHQERVKDFICETCGIECETEQEMAEHKESHENSINLNVNETEMEVDSPDINCRSCDDKFSSKTELWKHRKTHHVTYKPCRNIPNCKSDDK